MPRREALREMQGRLAERLAAVREQAAARSWLAVECAGYGFLLPLAQAGEIFALLPVLKVPHAHDWFVGVANLRGNLNGVVDLAAFLGLKRDRAMLREQSRLVALNPALGLNAALLVDRLAGLRNEAQLQADLSPAPAAPAFVAARMLDERGWRWQELDLEALANDEHFLQIVG